MVAGTQAPRVELLWWRGCPSWERTLDELREEMAGLGLDAAAVEVIEVDSDAEAGRRAFVGSPTIRIDGVDVQEPGQEATGVSCRIYRLRDGRISALPDPGDIRDALRAAMQGGGDG